jgi:hypothetical protein
VLSVPKRLRWYLEREPKAVTAVLHIFLRVVEAHLRRSCPGASAQARFGAVSFVYRFGASLNRHLHYHCCILDGVFEPLEAGRTALSLTPLEFIDHLAALIPPPRLHRHRYHGVLAPNAPLRLAATAYGRDADPDLIHPPLTHPPPGAAVPPPSPPAAAAPSSPSPAHYLWAMLLARLFESLPLVCPNGGADMRIIAFVTETAPVRRILKHAGEPVEPPRISPARGPPAWDDPPVDLGPDWEALAQASPKYVFNQEVQW